MLSVLGMTAHAAAAYVTGIYGNTMTANPRALEVGIAVRRRAQAHHGQPHATLPLGHDPADEFVLLRNRCRHAARGYASADNEIWSMDGRLLAYATQTMLLRLNLDD